MKKQSLLLFSMLVLLLAACTTVPPGHRGVKIGYSDGIDTTQSYPEGTYFSPSWLWNDMEDYNCREQILKLSDTFLDYDGLDTDVEVIMYYESSPSSVQLVHRDYGENYHSNIEGIFKSAVKTVVAQHQALKLNREERDIAESKLEDILSIKLKDIYQNYKRAEITDVGLPEKISNMIVQAKEQDERNNLAAKKELEQTNLARAKVVSAQGIKDSTILVAQGRAESIELINKQLAKSPQYNEYIKSQGYAQHGKSFYGENNVFGANTAVVKGLK